MKITIKHYDQTHTFETERNDLDIWEVAEAVKNLLVCAGYGTELVNQIINTDE
jgi:hypothetical protein